MLRRPNTPFFTLRRLRKLAIPAIATVTALFAISVPSAGAAPAVATPVTGLATSVTTTAVSTFGLLSAGILPLPTETTQESLQTVSGGLGFHFVFPVTGGTFDASGPSGTIDQSGGVRFVSFATFRMTKLSFFKLVLDGSPHIVASYLNNVATPVNVFDVDLSGASVSTSGSTTTILNATLRWTSDAATILNSSLGTGAFAAGATFGTLNTQIVS